MNCSNARQSNARQSKPDSYGVYNVTDVRDMASISYSMNPGQLPNTPHVAIGTGINRWESLFFDPQKNCIEPFPRIGINSVLPILDTQAKTCFPTYTSQGAITQELASYNDV